MTLTAPVPIVTSPLAPARRQLSDAAAYLELDHGLFEMLARPRRHDRGRGTAARFWVRWRVESVSNDGRRPRLHA
jgi:hypothetical protein